MKNRGFTLIELIIGFAIFLSILAMLSFYVRPIYGFFDKHTLYYQNIAQLNNMQHILTSDIERASKIDINSSGTLIQLTVDGTMYSYFTQDNYLIRKKINKIKLNSDKVLIDDFRIKRKGSLICIDYMVSLVDGESIVVKDTVYAYN